MENENLKPNVNNNSTDMQTKVDQTLSKGNELVQNTRDGLGQLMNASDSISNSLNNANNLINNINNAGNVFLESQRINSQTALGLKKIEEDHKTINKSIDNEYSKQKQAMDKASDVVDDGLKGNDIEKIRLGLAAMSGVANHNPMADLKNALNKEINNNFDDDDFYIEI